jgi:hypothetical protein
MLFETQLSDVLIVNDKFNDAEKVFVLRMNNRVLMNLVPTRLDLSLHESLNASNFLQPIELLEGTNLCSILLPKPLVVSKRLKAINSVHRERVSLLEGFMLLYNEEQRENVLQEDNFFPEQDEVSRDPLLNNPLTQCIKNNPPFLSTVEKILAYVFTKPGTENYNRMLINIMPELLARQEPSMEFLKFFIDAPYATMNLEVTSTKLTIMLHDEQLPAYSSKEIHVEPFDGPSVDSHIDLTGHVTYSILDNAGDKVAQIPCNHFYVDFRNQILQKKLGMFRDGLEVEEWRPTNFELSSYLH